MESPLRVSTPGPDDDRLRQALLNDALVELTGQLLHRPGLEESSDLVLKQARRLTGSLFGYVGYIDPEDGSLVCPTMTRDIWDSCQVPVKSIVFKEFGGLWGWALTHRQPILCNDPANDPRSSGVPAGHLPIHRFISVPIMVGDSLLGQIALANAPRPYTDADLKDLEKLGVVYALAIRQRHDGSSARDRNGAQGIADHKPPGQKLLEPSSLLAALLETTPTPIFCKDQNGVYLGGSRAFARLIGVPFEELAGKTVYDVAPRDLAAVYEEHDRLLMARRGRERYESQIHDADGALRDVIFDKAVFTEADGHVAGIVGVITDVTDLKRKAAELERSKSELEAIYEYAPVMMCVVDEHRRVRYANLALAKFMGLTCEDLRDGKACGILGCIHALDDPRGCGYGHHCESCSLRLAMEDTFRSGTSHRGIEYRSTLRLNDIDREVALLGGTALIRAGEQAPHLLLCLEDVTKRYQAEEKVRESNELLTLFIRHSPIYAYIKEVAPDTSRVLIASDNFVDMVGIPGAEMAGMSMEELFPPELAAKIIADDRSVVEQGNLLTLEETLDGRYYTTVKFPITQGGNRLLAGYTIDITDRTIVEERIKESEERLEAVLTGSRLGYWDWDIEQGTVHRNDRWAEMLGYTLEEITFTVRQWTDLIHPEDRERALRSLNDHLAGRSPQHAIEYRMLTKDGGCKWILDQATIVKRDSRGAPLRMSGTHTDVTERKRLDEVLLFLAQTPAETGEGDFFQHLAQYLAGSLEMDFICIDVLEEGNLSARTLAMFVDGAFEDNISYTLADTPCGEVVANSVCCYREGVRRHFLKDQVLQEMLAESYVGTILWSSDGRPIGLIAVIGRKPLAEPELAQKILGVVGVRAAAELELSLAMATLRNREAQYRAVIETSADGFLMSDRDGRIVEANDAYVRLSGYSRDELLTITVPDIEAVDTAEEIASRIDKVISVGSDHFESLHRSKNGALWPVEVCLAYWPSAGGYFFSFLRDIRIRNRSDALLRARLRLAELAPRVSLDGLMQAALDEAELLTGSCIGFFHFVDDDQEHLTLQTWSTATLTAMCTVEGKGLHYPVSEAGVWTDCLKTRKPVIHNDYAALTHKKGLPPGHAPVSRELVVPVRSGDRMTAIIGVGNKMTEYDDLDVAMLEEFATLAMSLVDRKRTESALQESEERYRTLFETMTEGAFYQRADGALIAVNPSALELFGLTRDEFLGRTSFHPEWRVTCEDGSVLAPEDHPSMRALRTGQPVSTAVAVYNPRTRENTWLQVNAIPQFSPGEEQPYQVFVILHDITQRRNAEIVQQKAMVELARSNEELERFAYVASHDLQEPIRMIVNYAQLLEMRYGEQLDGTAREFICYMVDGSRRMHQMINDLLAYSRVGTHGTLSALTDTGSSCAQALGNLKLMIEQSGATITMTELPTIMADNGHMVQLFQNLVGNALKFRGPDPPKVLISAREEGEAWRFEVKDNGIGLNPAQGDRIFKIFQRLHGFSEYPGTGIGLAVCKRIVERHGGRIWVESEPGQGATFIFTIPKALPTEMRED